MTDSVSGRGLDHDFDYDQEFGLAERAAGGPFLIAPPS